MTNKQMKFFKEQLAAADANSPIWYAGYAFLGLTERQCEEAYKILEAKGFEKKEDGTILMPSGLGIRQ